MKKKFIIYCKTFSRDIKKFAKMVQSFHEYNSDKILMYVSVPESELDMFSIYSCDLITILSDESFMRKYMVKNNKTCFTDGYINQEICKLSFWETGISENYFCIDSDSEFIRNFYISDFMADEETPYTILVQDKDLCYEKWYKKFWRYRYQKIKDIFEKIGSDDKRYRTCHGLQTMNAKVMESFKENYLNGNSKSYADIILDIPLEFTWYNAWLQKCKIIPEYSIEPLFKCFHTRTQYILSRFSMVSKHDISKSYIGIVMNSNWGGGSYKKPGFVQKLFYKLVSKD